MLDSGSTVILTAEGTKCRRTQANTSIQKQKALDGRYEVLTASLNKLQSNQ